MLKNQFFPRTAQVIGLLWLVIGAVAQAQTDPSTMPHPSVLMDQAQAHAASGRLDLARSSYLQVINDPRSDEVFVIAYPNSKITLSTAKNIARQNLATLDAKEQQMRAAAAAALPAPTSVPPAPMPAAIPVQAVEVKPAPSMPQSNVPGTGWEASITQTMQSWVDTWTAKNLQDYYLHYASDFQGKVKSVEAWRKGRAGNISDRKVIEIDLKDISLKALSANQVEVTFVQAYKSNVYKDTVKKTLGFIKVGDRWLINKETTTK